jgi:hypothetical protein
MEPEADKPYAAVMARPTRRTTLSLDADALNLAERVAKLRGISISSLASRAIRNEALRLGAPKYCLNDDLDAERDEAERVAMEADRHRPEGRAA